MFFINALIPSNDLIGHVRLNGIADYDHHLTAAEVRFVSEKSGE
jgi:hypothetical protein